MKKLEYYEEYKRKQENNPINIYDLTIYDLRLIFLLFTI